MAPPLLFDISKIDLDRVAFGVDEIEQLNPQRGAMRMLDGVVWTDDTFSAALAFHDVRDDEFWVEGHIPGRPLFPGVLMIESAAQLASFLSKMKLGRTMFMGFAGLDEVKFRGQVAPGQRLLMLYKEIDLRSRRAIGSSQGWVDGKLVYEGIVTGMPV